MELFIFFKGGDFNARIKPQGKKRIKRFIQLAINHLVIFNKLFKKKTMKKIENYK